MPVQDLAEYFYADYGLVASPRPERLQKSFGILTDLFDRVGLRKNVRKTARMSCRPCHTPGSMSEASYERQMTGVGPSYWERLRQQATGEVTRVRCGDSHRVADGTPPKPTRSCSEKLHLQHYLEMLWSGTGYFALLGNNIILVIILLDLIER